MAEFGASKDVSEEVDLHLNVVLRSQAREVATHEHIEVDSCSYRGRRALYGTDMSVIYRMALGVPLLRSSISHWRSFSTEEYLQTVEYP